MDTEPLWALSSLWESEALEPSLSWGNLVDKWNGRWLPMLPSLLQSRQDHQCQPGSCSVSCQPCRHPTGTAGFGRDHCSAWSTLWSGYLHCQDPLQALPDWPQDGVLSMVLLLMDQRRDLGNYLWERIVQVFLSAGGLFWDNSPAGPIQWGPATRV